MTRNSHGAIQSEHSPDTVGWVNSFFQKAGVNDVVADAHEDEIDVITIDNPPVNAFGQAVREACVMP